VVLASGPAAAFFDDDEHLLEYTAHTLDGGEWRLGVWDVGFGVTRFITVDTYMWPWLLKMANASAKLRFWSDSKWTVAGKLGFFRFDSKSWAESETSGVLKIVPMEGVVTHRLDKNMYLSVGMVYTHIGIEGSSDEQKVEGAAAYSNLQATAALEYRFSRRWAAILRTRHLLHMEISGQASTPMEIDEYTTMVVHASGGSDDFMSLGFPQTFQVMPVLAFSDRSINIEAGLALGNWNVPGVNFVFPTKIFFPQGDLYFRF